eukprot:5158142-Pyramimonas_sp.AAC.2
MKQYYRKDPLNMYIHATLSDTTCKGGARKRNDVNTKGNGVDTKDKGYAHVHGASLRAPAGAAVSGQAAAGRRPPPAGGGGVPSGPPRVPRKRLVPARPLPQHHVP